MKVDRGWIWRVIFLTTLVVTAIRAQDEQSDVEVSDIDEDLSLNEEELKVLLAEGEEEMVTIMDKDELDMSGKDDGVENVSFQVSNGQYFKLKFSTFSSFKTRNNVVCECQYQWEPC